MEKTEFYEVLLIGDTGALSLKNDHVFQLLKKAFPGDSRSALIFLGDLIYPRGLPPENHSLRKEAEAKLLAQLDTVKDFPGRLFFLSGNHDWNRGKKDGYEYVLRQEKYIKNYFQQQQVYLPSGGCPGPEEINLGTYCTIILINTQWWVQRGFRPAGEVYNCKINTEEDFFSAFENMLERNKDKRVLVAGHLPIYSYGIHGGYCLPRHHLFPLTIYKKKLYVPLPGIGSMMTLYRKYIGIREDLAHPRYRRFRKKMKAILQNFPNVIYAAGHEHNLQYIKKRQGHFIISGAGSKTQFLRHGKHLVFGDAIKGFFKLRIYSDKRVEIEVWEADAGELNPVFKTYII